LIKIIAVGKIKDKYFKDAIDEYIKRLSKYVEVKIIEVDDSNMEKEKELIEKNINVKDFVITLEIEGKQLSSIDLAKKIDSVFNNYPNLCFIIGGSDGLHNSIKEKSNYQLSFSKLTFTHQMFRVMLLEQVYRAYKINNNETYHK